MCGITGFWDFQVKTKDAPRVLQNMMDTLKIRGPDDQGAWYDPSQGAAFGHRILKIQDLSAAARQPMISPCGQYVLSFNGELYNADALRGELAAAGWVFKSSGDTEVLLAACTLWGVHQAATRILGMFAFSFWDGIQKQLCLVRDRTGIKPLYWGRHGNSLIFGSELKAFMPHPAFQKRLNTEALALYFRYNYVPTPHCIFENTFKQKPGTILRFDASGDVREEVYWRVPTFTNAVHAPDEKAAIQGLHTLLKDVVLGHMISDVPLGAFLSGGIDSSLVVALMQSQRSNPVQTFSIGFSEAGYDEAPHAKAVAKHLGTHHHELYVSSQAAQAVIPELPELFDEPFADVSQIPTYLVSRLARTGVTVALSGDGGDECFAGYNRYAMAAHLWQKIHRLPTAMRSSAAHLLRSMSPGTWDLLGRALPTHWAHAGLGDKIYKAADLLEQTSPENLYRQLVTFWPDPNALLHPELRRPLWENPLFSSYKPSDSLVSWMQEVDLGTYLPDDILTKVDRASMAVSLESRVPLLDSRLIEYAAQTPLDLRVRGGQGKWILRQILKEYVPTALFERPKMGFGVPIDSWLRGPLRDWGEELLSERALLASGVLDPTPIRKIWAEHLSGRRNFQYRLWSVLMFQLWHQKWMA